VSAVTYCEDDNEAIAAASIRDASWTVDPAIHVASSNVAHVGGATATTVDTVTVASTNVLWYLNWPPTVDAA
jgi:hypothetical protein